MIHENAFLSKKVNPCALTHKLSCHPSTRRNTTAGRRFTRTYLSLRGSCLLQTAPHKRNRVIIIHLSKVNFLQSTTPPLPYELPSVWLPKLIKTLLTSSGCRPIRHYPVKGQGWGYVHSQISQWYKSTNLSLRPSRGFEFPWYGNGVSKGKV